ncbi:hypothetical protein DLJ49_16150 [Rhodovulum sp. 12E13]|uniref:hypothetical protein n=1 Tax=Rhodovulum sp. 12E13 TaxID=2203891 RepID=UPI000E11E8B1|nr:hypothetical protein [Rhodovulum sp. 12E13]RDC71060.1 hypothetical protein DLJ49_16150 [Rhodovulum sp. 12E13]
MDGLILAGVALSVAGLGGILWCIVTVWRAKRAGLDDDALRARLQRVVTVNLAALLTSALGLGLIAVGLILA